MTTDTAPGGGDLTTAPIPALIRRLAVPASIGYNTTTDITELPTQENPVTTGR